MKSSRRKSTPKVVDGRVQRKNRAQIGNGYGPTTRCAIERKRAGYDFKHVVTREDVYRFIQIVPGWDQLAVGLDKIVLDEGSEYRAGWFSRGEIGLCAFPKDLATEFASPYFYRDADFFHRFSVPFQWDSECPDSDSIATVHFNAWTAKYYHLMRTLVHELGHHQDLVTNRRDWCSRGEEYAENVGRQLEQAMYRDYVRLFGRPPRDSCAPGRQQTEKQL